jgi:hypothetical protein
MDGSKMKMMEEGEADRGYDRKQAFMEMMAAKSGKKGKPAKGKAKKKPAKKTKPKGKRGKALKPKGSMADELNKIFGGRR